MSEEIEIEEKSNNHPILYGLYILIYVILSISIFIMTGMLLSKGSNQKAKLWGMYSASIVAFIATLIALIAGSSTGVVALFIVAQFFLGIMSLEETNCYGNLLSFSEEAPVALASVTGEAPKAESPLAMISDQTNKLALASYLSNGGLLIILLMYFMMN
jgi:hypothetical protein